ncbi:MAG: RDD family protein [Solirubrobacterales bacterium]
MPSDPQDPQQPPQLPSRLLGIGARGAERMAAATGIDDAVERTTEEAIVRALESPAVERAIVRVLESDEAQAALERTLSSPAVERAAVRVLDSELVDHVWDRLLASDEAQKLVERIAEAPEVRAAIAQQGFGLIQDVGRQIREIADRVDNALERVARRLRGRTAAPEEARQRVGLATRAVAAAVDAGVLNLMFLGISALFGLTIGGVLGDDEGTSGWQIAVGAGLWISAGAIYLGFFWALSGQTPGMRFLSIRLDVDGRRHVGTRRAVRRLLGTALSILSFGIGFLMVLFDDRRRSLADRIAGTEVIEDDGAVLAPHST